MHTEMDDVSVGKGLQQIQPDSEVVVRTSFKVMVGPRVPVKTLM